MEIQSEGEAQKSVLMSLASDSKLLKSSEITKYRTEIFVHRMQHAFQQIWKFQFSSVAQSCPTVCDPMNCSMPGFPVHHQPLEIVQINSHLVGDSIQPLHSLSSPSPPTFNLSQHQGLFK